MGLKFVFQSWESYRFKALISKTKCGRPRPNEISTKIAGGSKDTTNNILIKVSYFFWKLIEFQLHYNIPKTLKMVLDTTLLNTQHYKVRFKGKVEQSWEWSSALPTPWCSSYRKGSLRVTLDYGR